MIRNRRKFLQQLVSVVIVPCVGINYFQEKRIVAKDVRVKITTNGKEIIVLKPIKEGPFEFHFINDKNKHELTITEMATKII